MKKPLAVVGLLAIGAALFASVQDDIKSRSSPLISRWLDEAQAWGDATIPVWASNAAAYWSGTVLPWGREAPVLAAIVAGILWTVVGPGALAHIVGRWIRWPIWASAPVFVVWVAAKLDPLVMATPKDPAYLVDANVVQLVMAWVVGIVGLLALGVALFSARLDHDPGEEAVAIALSKLSRTVDRGFNNLAGSLRSGDSEQLRRQTKALERSAAAQEQHAQVAMRLANEVAMVRKALEDLWASPADVTEPALVEGVLITSGQGQRQVPDIILPADPAAAMLSALLDQAPLRLKDINEN